MNLLLELPVLPWVKKYLDAKYSGVYKLSESDAIGQLLSGLLKKQKRKKEYNEFLPRYSKKFLVEISANRAYNRRERSFTSITVIRFNSFIEALIKEEMYVLIDLSIEYKLQTRASAIRSFMNKYDFAEEDIQYETLLKSYQRYTAAKLAKKLFSSAGKKTEKIQVKKNGLFVQSKKGFFSPEFTANSAQIAC